MHSHMALLLGHYRKSGAFQGGADFIKAHLAAGAALDACPADFEAIDSGAQTGGNVCSLGGYVQTVMDGLRKHLETELAPHDTAALRTRKEEVRAKVRELREQQNEQKELVREFDLYGEYLAFLALKGQCYEVLLFYFYFALHPLFIHHITLLYSGERWQVRL